MVLIVALKAKTHFVLFRLTYTNACESPLWFTNTSNRKPNAKSFLSIKDGKFKKKSPYSRPYADVLPTNTVID